MLIFLGNRIAQHMPCTHKSKELNFSYRSGRYGKIAYREKFKLATYVNTSLVILCKWRIHDFPEGGGAKCASLYFCRKLPEHERIWTPGGRIPGAPLKSANAYKSAKREKSQQGVNSIETSITDDSINDIGLYNNNSYLSQKLLGKIEIFMISPQSICQSWYLWSTHCMPSFRQSHVSDNPYQKSVSATD